MTYCFDIDGTLCSNTGGDYWGAVPFQDMIREVNRLFSEGHRILLYTARGATTGVDWRELTRQQLKEWGVCYHELYMGKPTADIYIDDRAMNSTEWQRNGFKVDLARRGNTLEVKNRE